MSEKRYDLDRSADDVLGRAKKQDAKTKVVIILVDVAILAVLLIAVLQENVFVGWREYQDNYLEILQNKATDDWGKKLADNYKVQIAQIYIPELDISDRCITCHTGIDDPRMPDVPNPYRFHPGDHHKNHDPQKFGCTTCHSGQGRAIEKEKAHGLVDHWLYPRLTGESVYSSCSNCHIENDLYGGREELYALEESARPISSQAIEATIPGFDSGNSLSIVRGKKRVLNSGCLGCHKYRGRGGTMGPDISYTGDKTAHDFPFEHVDGPRTVSQWLFKHFTEPDQVSPDTLMPDMKLTDRQARDMTNYMLSLRRKTLPAKYMPAPKAGANTPATGPQLYALFCAACHGADGSGSTTGDPKAAKTDVSAELMVPSLNNPDTLAVASDQYFESIIRNGRDNTNMVAWSSQKQGHLADQEIKRLVQKIRSWQEPPFDINVLAAKRGDKRDGSVIYKEKCTSCHGSDGQGAIGPSLNSKGFLSVVSDRFFGLAMAHGRPNTAMPSYRDLDTQRTKDTIAYIRSWHELKSRKEKVLERLVSAKTDADVSADIGKKIYESKCQNCHEPDGKGDLGPNISKQEYLSIIDADYLYETLAYGREGTGMPAGREFSDKEMASLIMHIDTWLKSPRRNLPPTRIDGDKDTGKILFAAMCVNCHGENAEGASGPQLANHQFLNQTNDLMLAEWIAHGKLDTKTEGIVGLTEDQIYNIVAHLRSLEYADLPPINKFTSGRPERGQEWFSTFCSPCHGEKGAGASGPSLANHQFLNAASSGYLVATMAIGRDDTGMKSVVIDDPQSTVTLESDQVNDVVAYLRTLEYDSPKDAIMHNFVIDRDLEHGRVLYQSNCGECHGVNGRSKIPQKDKLTVRAPELNNKQFLDSATDGFLQATIINGRRGTAMKSFGLYPEEPDNPTPEGVNEPVNLTPEEVDDIVAYIRSWSNLPLQSKMNPAKRNTMEKNR